jgi:hypothetical protein
LILDGAGAVTSTAAITGTAGTSVPTVTINANQSFASLTNAGTSNFNAGSTTIGTIANTGTTNVASAATLNATSAFSEGLVNNAGTININGGSSNVVGQGNGIGGGASTTGGISGAGTLNVTCGNLVAAHIRQAQLNIASGSTVTIADSLLPGDGTAVNAATSVLTDLNLSPDVNGIPTATLDLKNNDLIINDTNPAVFTTVQAALSNAADIDGSGNLHWDKPGITSSSAAANASTFALGYATGAELSAASIANGGSAITTFDGQPLSSGATVVKYTVLGDTNLKGYVNNSDYFTVLNNAGADEDWAGGNFKYSATGALAQVNNSDYFDVLNNAGSTVSGNLAQGRSITRSLAPSLSVSPNIPTRVAPAGDLQLYVYLATGDVRLVNTNQTQSTPFTSYEITVNDKSTNVLTVGNPQDGLGTGYNGTTGAPYAPNTFGQTGPFTNEMFLTAAQGDPNYNSSAAAYGSTPSKWAIVLDGYNSHAPGTSGSAFGLWESFAAVGTSDVVTIPVGGSIDLGNIFNNLASTTDLTYDWSPATVTGANSGTTYDNASIDYIPASTPEPGTLGILGLGGVMMMRRRRSQRRSALAN